MTTEITKRNGDIFHIYFETGQVFGRLKIDLYGEMEVIKALVIVHDGADATLVELAPDQIKKVIKRETQQALEAQARQLIQESLTQEQ